MNARLRIYGWILVFIGALSASPKSQSQTYRVTDLGANTVGQAINGAGQIVGYYTNASGASRPFIWTSGILTDLGTLGGTGGEAFGINTPGQVVGQSNIAGDAYHHATLWSVGTVTDLGTFNQVCCSNSHANAINDTGQIVGATDVSCGPPTPPPLGYAGGAHIQQLIGRKALSSPTDNRQ
jgi:probable HAF family extracellular repeat protein